MGFFYNINNNVIIKSMLSNRKLREETLKNRSRTVSKVELQETAGMSWIQLSKTDKRRYDIKQV